MNDLAAAAALVAAAPARYGGLWLRGLDAALVDAVLALLADRLSCRKLPLTVDEERLLGGLDLTATLETGRPVHRAGLLEEMRGGVLVIAGAERLAGAIAGRIAAAMDGGGPAIVLIDEGGDEEVPPACLTERVAFWFGEWSGLAETPLGASAKGAAETPVHAFMEELGVVLPSFPSADVEESKSHPRPLQQGLEGSPVSLSQADMNILAGTAVALGVRSARGDLFALRAAQDHAAQHRRDALAEEDLAFAARTILAPRATQVPAAPEEAPPPEEQAQRATDQPRPLEDVVLAAARAALPPALLDALADGRGRGVAPAGRGAGERRRSLMRGRPLGARAGLPRGGARLALMATLRAAAPWQRLRAEGSAPRRLHLRRGDLHIRRFEDRIAALTIVAVDASGSAAAQRLAEAKGAVELLLQQSYARRAEVALIAFRGTGAELLLPPTRSLTRARRLLGDLPGGGGTPIAAGLEAARQVAAGAAQRGRTPALVVLTDGRANIAVDGRQDRAAAQGDALAAARRIAADGLRAILIDIGPRKRPEAAMLAEALAARYLHLPRADAAAMHAALAS